MKIYTNICVAILLMMLFSCSSKPSESVISFKMDSLVDDIPKAEIFASLNYATLDTALVAVFRNADRIAMRNGKIYILDVMESQLLMFDESGKFIKKIQTIGRGPREYERVREFYIDGDQVVLYSDAPGKYLYYDLDLNFVNEVTATKPVYYNMALDSSNGMIYGTIVAGQNTIGSWKRDDVNKVTELLPSLPKIASVTTAQSRINNSKCILFTRMYDNNIYTFKDGKESVKFVVDFGSSNFPKAYLDRTFDMMEFFRTMKDENLVYGISNAIETDRFLIFMTNLNSLCVYDKVTKSARVTQWLGGESIYSMVPINYADNSVAFVRHSERGANIAIATFIK